MIITHATVTVGLNWGPNDLKNCLDHKTIFIKVLSWGFTASRLGASKYTRKWLISQLKVGICLESLKWALFCWCSVEVTDYFHLKKNHLFSWFILLSVGLHCTGWLWLSFHLGSNANLLVWERKKITLEQCWFFSKGELLRELIDDPVQFEMSPFSSAFDHLHGN